MSFRKLNGGYLTGGRKYSTYLNLVNDPSLGESRYSLKIYIQTALFFLSGSWDEDHTG